MTSINNAKMQGVNAINANQTKQPAKVEAKAEEVKAESLNQLVNDFTSGKITRADFQAKAEALGVGVSGGTNLLDAKTISDTLKSLLKTAEKSGDKKGAGAVKEIADMFMQADNIKNDAKMSKADKEKAIRELANKAKNKAESKEMRNLVENHNSQIDPNANPGEPVPEMLFISCTTLLIGLILSVCMAGTAAVAIWCFGSDD